MDWDSHIGVKSVALTLMSNPDLAALSSTLIALLLSFKRLHWSIFCTNDVISLVHFFTNDVILFVSFCFCKWSNSWSYIFILRDNVDILSKSSGFIVNLKISNFIGHFYLPDLHDWCMICIFITECDIRTISIYSHPPLHLSCVMHYRVLFVCRCDEFRKI